MMTHRVRTVGLAVVLMLAITAPTLHAAALSNITVGRFQDFTVVTLFGEESITVTHQIVEAKDGKPHRIVIDLTGATHKLPALILWGGPTDNFVINFEGLSLELERSLQQDGHFVVECIHNCGHGVPPPDPGTGTNAIEGALNSIVQFALDHPYWLGPGESPWNATGLPPGTPSFCGIGVGSAVPRTGDCTGGFGI